MTAPAIPENPLTFIKECVSHNRIYWTYHVNMRMRNRFVSRKMILQSFQEYEIIESYPTDKYLPSYLVFSKHEDITFHVFFLLMSPSKMYVLSRHIFLIPACGIMI
jgi:hypothetical protein